MNSKRTRKRYNKNSKIIIIMVLMIGVIGLSIGFSAFSKNLDINSTATVTPDPSDFKILFSSSKDSVVAGDLNYRVIKGTALGFPATIDNSDSLHPKITGLKATLTNPDDLVNWGFYVTNQGKYTAYLKKIEFGDKKCIAKEGTSQDLVDKVCEGIIIEIHYDGNDVSLSAWNIEGLKTTRDNITEHPLEKETFKYIIISIFYKNNNNNVFADGDFDVTFGDITLTYSTTDS